MRSLCCFLLFLCVSAVALAQQASAGSAAVVPTLVNFSGVVRDVSGKPLAGVVGVTFSLYKESQGGPPLWMETQNVQPDKSGHYTVMLGSTTSQGLPAGLFAAGEARWLGVQLQGQEEEPRVLLLSVPYALKAADAQTLGGLPPSAFALVGTASAVSKPGAASVSKSSFTPPPAPPPGTSNVTTMGGTVHTLPLFTSATNIQSSIVTQSGTSAIHVKGQLNVGPPGPTDGILNTAANSRHAGLSSLGWSIPANTAGSGTDAIHASGGNADPYTFVGSTSGGIGAVITGGEGQSGGAGAVITGGAGDPDFGAGPGPGLIVKGGISLGFDFGGADGIQAQAGSGGNGLVASAGAALDQGAGAGVIGTGGTTAQGQYGVPAGPGLVGHGGSDVVGGDGIDAFAGTTSCSNCAKGLAGSFTGDVAISGNLDVSGTKSFRIDHPLDPANKYLYHAALESSEVLNLYSGNVPLDASGEASVQLPNWFQSLNQDYRYQLTAVGAAAPNLHIAQEIQNNNFKIAGGAAGMKVSWQVTGVRADAWEKAHPMVVEVQKPQRERGYYINPELFGAPPERSTDWVRVPQVMKRLRSIEQEQAAERQALLKKHVKSPKQ